MKKKIEVFPIDLSYHYLQLLMLFNPAGTKGNLEVQKKR